MQKGHHLEFKCIDCQQPVSFSLVNAGSPFQCHRCSKQYSFQDENLIRQLKKFEALCRQIRDSEEILEATSVGVHVGDHEVSIPYKLLLARLKGQLTLSIEGQPVTINFQLEPIKDFALTSDTEGLI